MVAARMGEEPYAGAVGVGDGNFLLHLGKEKQDSGTQSVVGEGFISVELSHVLEITWIYYEQ